MKKIASFLICATLCILLTGCTKYQATFEIDKNQNVNVSVFGGFNVDQIFSFVIKTFGASAQDYDFKSAMKKGMQEELKKEQKKPNNPFKNYTASIIEDGNFIGVQYKKSFKGIDNIELPKGYYSKQNKFIETKKSFLKTEYSLHLEVDLDEIKVQDEAQQQQINNNPALKAQVEKLQKDLAKVSINDIVIKTPYRASKTNAHKRDDVNLVYTWNIDILAKGKMPIQITYEEVNTQAIAIAVIAGLLLLLFAIKTCFPATKE